MNYINISAYKFVNLAETKLTELRLRLKEKALNCDLKGTILLSTEGINLFISGIREKIDEYKQFLESIEKFRNLPYKESVSNHQPFSRMLVRLKKEIIAMGKSHVVPEKKTAPHVFPEDFKNWYAQKRDMIVLDTRNDYEVALGTFEKAIDLNIETFRSFPDAVALLPKEYKEKPVVTFCTGGIRCEKAAEYMLQQGFKEVYQLEGGILNYFEKCGGKYYHGECFVFDKRVAVDTDLLETKTTQCYACRNPLPLEQQLTDEICPHCGKNRFKKK